MPKVELALCPNCKRMYENKMDRDYCPVCYEIIEDKFTKVKRYIKENQMSGVHEVSEACNIPKRQILKWVREERLYFSENSDVGVPCLQCGLVIQTGKYCESCKRKLQKDLKGFKMESPKNDDVKVNITGRNRMRYMDHKKER